MERVSGTEKGKRTEDVEHFRRQLDDELKKLYGSGLDIRPRQPHEREEKK